MKGVLMRGYLATVVILVLGVGSARAAGLLVPEDRRLPPLAMLSHEVTVTIEDQVAVTKVDQTFRNHTDRPLEATYLFPVPRGASVRRFSMWVGGREVGGELVEADRARQIYTDIVRRTQDPGLLEYLGNNLLRVRVFPVAAHGDQRLSVSYTSVAARDQSVVEYVYPLRTAAKATRTLEKFSIEGTLRSQHPIQNVYSPTHAITVTRPGDREAVVHFDRDQALLDHDFQFFYAVGDQDVGLTAVTHRPRSDENGYFLMLLSPRFEIPASQLVPRDVVFVLDTSGSMRGVKMDQARRALKYCLGNLGPRDRFGLMNFATTVTPYSPGLLENSREQVDRACRWVDGLEANGGTAIRDALLAALDLRPAEPGRTFTIIFFTDGQPTIGETDPEKILKAVASRNSANTRVFTFGVGDDVNATMLDRLAEESRAVATYVRPAEDIESKASALFTKISHPVMTDLKLTASAGISLLEVYPPRLPDLFQGGQVVVLGRYSGAGHAALTLTGMVGKESRQFVFETRFSDRTSEDRAFVEHLWARRKVGYLLDQIRANGEKKELVDEVVTLAKKYGITTPYTSYLVVPDASVPVARGGRSGGERTEELGVRGVTLVIPQAAPPQRVADFARQMQTAPGELAANRARMADEALGHLGRVAQGTAKAAYEGAQTRKQAYDLARAALARRDANGVQAGKLGVDLSIETSNLRNQLRLEQTAQRLVAGRNCLEVGGVWIDDRFDAHTPTLVVKAMSDAYFRLLERQPQLREVFQLGNQLVWVTPSGRALVIDPANGKDQLADADIDALFGAR